MSVLPIGFGSSSGYNIDNSVRLRASASAYLSSTFGTPTDATRGTFVFRVKRGTLSSIMQLFQDGTNEASINFLASNAFEVNANDAGSNKYNDTNKLYRDSSAWYYILVAIDTNLGTAADRLKIYDCDVRLTLSASSNFGSGTSPKLLQAGTKHLGSYNGTQDFFDGLFSDIYFIDGQALTPSDFGELNTDGVWVPKVYTGTYGTNGFHLDFKDAAVTSGSNAGLGKDVSGNGNYWNTTNISVTAGVTYDSMVDTPTNNYATLNPLANATLTSVTFKDGNLGVTTSAARQHILSSFRLGPEKKYYWECSRGNASGSDYQTCGIALLNTKIDSSPSYINPNNVWGYANSGKKVTNGTASGAIYTVSSATTDVWGFEWDGPNSTLTCYLNNTSLFSCTSLTGEYVPYFGIETPCDIWVNMGQRPFAYTPPTGFKSLCTANLPSVAIKKPASHFDVRSRAATGGTATVTGYAFAPALTWIKSRTFGNPHYLADYVRGANKFLGSDTTAAEDTGKTDELTAFTSDGYTLGASANGYTNLTPSARNYVDWNWKAGGAPSTDNVAGAGNTPTAGSVKIDGANLGSALAGTIAATRLSANTTAGFSIVTYTGNGSASATVAHGLGVTPNLVIVKTRNRTGENFRIHHSSVSLSNTLYFNTTAAQADGDRVSATSSTTFTLSSGGAPINSSPDTYVAYCFAEIPGYSKFGSYVGNGLTDGPFVYCGFRPKFLMIKCSSTTSHWALVDAARSLYNVTDAGLYADNSAAENTGAAFGAGYDFVSNGFKARLSVTNEENVSGQTYIFAAFAEHPFGGGNVAPAPAR
jgi:hypothetical protein